MRRLVLAIIISVGCVVLPQGCRHIDAFSRFITDSAGRERIAQIGSNALYKKDIKRLLPPNISKQDSSAMVDKIIQDWTLEILLEENAKKLLSKEDLDIEKDIEKYRRSLLVYKYKDKYIKEKLDTIIAQQEIEAYYKENADKLKLQYPIYKVTLIKIRRQSPYCEMVRSLYRNNETEKEEELVQLCTSSADLFTDYDGQWIESSTLAKETHLSHIEVEEKLSQSDCVDFSDSLYLYCIKCNKKFGKGETAPFEYKKTDIIQILLSKRKQELLQNLEKETLKDGWSNSRIKIFTRK